MRYHHCAFAPQGSRPHALSPAYRGPVEGVEGETRFFWLSDVAHSWAEKRTSMARVRGREQAARHSPVQSVYGSRNGYVNTTADCGSAERHAGSRGGDRLGRGARSDLEVILPAHPASAFAQSLPSVVREALRAAALAQNDRTALDIVGAALLRVAALVGVEGHRHG
ncbi:hypothetical protein EXE55_14395 [Burkholderia glumae]|nr:hypothetical protein EXE55_14395 [Burkholderia glumae]